MAWNNPQTVTRKELTNEDKAEYICKKNYKYSQLLAKHLENSDTLEEAMWNSAMELVSEKQERTFSKPV